MAGLLDDLLHSIAPAGYTPPVDPRLGLPSLAMQDSGPPGGMPQLPPGALTGGPPPSLSGAFPGLLGGGPQAPPDASAAAPPDAPQPPPTRLLEPGAPGTAEANPAPGFLSRIMSPDPEGVTLRDKMMALGSIMKGDSEGAQRTIADARAQGQKRAAYAQIDSMFPDNPMMRFMMRMDPAEAMKFLVPQKLGKGERFVQPPIGGGPGAAGGGAAGGGAAGGVPGGDVMDYGVEGGVPWTMDSTGKVSWQGARPPNAAELETKAHNQFQEQNETARLAWDKQHGTAQEGIERGRLGVEQQQAGTAAAHLGLDKITAARQANPSLPVVMNETALKLLKPGDHWIDPNGDVRVK
jgi:hypothetical protein